MPYQSIKDTIRLIVTALQADLMPNAGLEAHTLFIDPPLHDNPTYRADTVGRFEGDVGNAIDLYIQANSKACVLVGRVRSQGGRQRDDIGKSLRKIDPIAVIAVVQITKLDDMTPAAEYLDDLEEAIELVLEGRRTPNQFGVYNITWQGVTALPGSSNWGARMVIFDVSRNRVPA